MPVRSPTVRPERHRLSGWGESIHGAARVYAPTDVEGVEAALRRLAEEGRRVTLRGAGRSYGDAALAAGGDVLDLQGLTGVRSFDADAGRIEVECGVTIEQLWRHVVGHGWWPAVVPGTMRPTIGGCVAMNIHGKNQYRAGVFGDHVEEIEWLRPDGERVRLTPGGDPELFRAVVGGFGQLGVVTAARLRLKRIHAGGLKVTAVPTPDLAAVHAVFDEFEDRSDYLVAWLDCFDRNARGVIHAASHFAPGETWHGTPGLAATEQELPGTLFGVLPRALLSPLMQPFGRPAGLRWINRAKYLAAWFHGRTSFPQSHAQFAFLLDYVPRWKRIYDPGGLIQHQSFVPREAALEVHGRQLAMCREAGLVSWLGVYKRHRPDGYLMSHSVDGYSLALDFPVTRDNRERLWGLCRRMDELVLDAGGCFYFAKDATALPESLPRAYPGLPRFLELKRRLDPEHRFGSDLADRLGI